MSTVSLVSRLTSVVAGTVSLMLSVTSRAETVRPNGLTAIPVIFSDDLDVSERWYTDLLGFSRLRSKNDSVMLIHRELKLNIVKCEGSYNSFWAHGRTRDDNDPTARANTERPENCPRILMKFESEDLEPFASYLKKARYQDWQGEMHDASPEEGGKLICLYLTDPFGNNVRIMRPGYEYSCL